MDTGSVAVEKKKRKRGKKNKKATKQVVNVIVDDENTDSDEDEDDIFNYLNMSPSSAQAQSHNSSNLAAQQLNAYEGNHMEDPVSHTIGLVTELSNGSYTLDRVTDCVHRMWDTGLQYDSVEAVLKELSREDEHSRSNVKSAQKQQPPTPPSDSMSSVQVDRSPSPPPPAASVEQQVHVRSEDSPVTTTSSSTSSPTHQPPVSSPVASSSVPEYTLSARLELAASHPDMSEALVALETWCRLVGPTTASKEFFECQALEILLKKLISQPALIQKAAVKDALDALFLHVFPSPVATETTAAAPLNASALVSSLETFLEQISQLNVLQISSEKSSTPLATRISDSLRAVHALFLNEQNDMQDKGSQYALETDICARKKRMGQIHQKLLGSGDEVKDDVVQVESSGSNIRDILELADVTQDLLNLQLEKHASQVSAAAAGKKSSAVPKPALANITGSHAADKKLEAHVLAASGSSRNTIDNLKAQAASISTYYDRLSSENDSILAPYRRDFIKCNETLTNLQQNYQYMQLQLKNIENEMNMVKSQAASIQADIDKIKLQQDARMNDLTTSHTDVVEAIEKDKEMQIVLENVRKLESTFDANTHAIWGKSSSSEASPSASSGGQPGVEGVELEGIFENYVLAEMKCTQFLCKRNSLMIEKTSHLEREIVEYTNLGMKNLAADITKSIEVLKENRLEDVAALEGIQESLYTNMLRVKGARNVVISQQAMQYLHEIATSLRDTGVALHPDISHFLHYQATAPAQKQQKQQKQAPVVPASSAGSTAAAPLPPRAKRGGKKEATPPTSPTPSSVKPREVTPPPGLRLPTPPPTPPSTATSATTTASTSQAPPAAPSWSGWGTIPKVSEPFTISK